MNQKHGKLTKSDSILPRHRYATQLLNCKRIVNINVFCIQSLNFSRPSRMPKLYINRRAASEHKSDPSQDPEGKNTVFMQIYEGLKPRDRYEKPLDYRYSPHYN